MGASILNLIHQKEEMNLLKELERSAFQADTFPWLTLVVSCLAVVVVIGAYTIYRCHGLQVAKDLRRDDKISNAEAQRLLSGPNKDKLYTAVSVTKYDSA